MSEPMTNAQYHNRQTYEYLVKRCGQLLQENERLAEQNAAMRPIVEAVAEADNSDSGVCYQICNVRWYGGETDAEEMDMRHDSPCIVGQAETFIAAQHPATGESEG